MTGMLRFHPVVAIEYFGQISRLNAHTQVFYTHYNLTSLNLTCYRYLISFGRIFYGIADVIGDDRSDLIPVGVYIYSRTSIKIDLVCAGNQLIFFDNFPD